MENENGSSQNTEKPAEAGSALDLRREPTRRQRPGLRSAAGGKAPSNGAKGANPSSKSTFFWRMSVEGRHEIQVLRRLGGRFGDGQSRARSHHLRDRDGSDKVWAWIELRQADLDRSVIEDKANTTERNYDGRLFESGRCLSDLAIQSKYAVASRFCKQAILLWGFRSKPQSSMTTQIRVPRIPPFRR